MKKIILNLVKKNKFLGDIIRNFYLLFTKIYYKVITCFIKTEKKTILFSSFNGRSYCDSPKAIYKYMLKDDKYKDYTFIWIFKDTKQHKDLLKNKNTIVVSTKKNKLFKAFKRAKYWFLNYNVEEYIPKGKKQVLVQCWHGTPLKRLGYDLEHIDSALNSLKTTRKRYKRQALKFDYFISPSAFASEKFTSIWNLKEIKKEDCMLEVGYPRNDFLINYKQKDILNVKKKLLLEKNKKKIILYAPTYRDNQHKAGVGYTYKTEVDFDYLKEQLEEEYIILFRSHWLVAQNFNFNKYKGFIYDVSSYDDINDLYIISDILVTDYSSVFFDFANLKKPILFYMYDLEEYRDDIRGFYLDVKDLPGPIIKNEKDLIKQIKNIKDFYNKKYQLFNKCFNYLDDGKASKRVVEKVIGSDLNEK